MAEITHDTYPVRLKGQRKATLILPVVLTPEDAELICKHVTFIAECSVDHNQEPTTQQEPHHD